MHLLHTPVPCDWHFVLGALGVNVLIACLKSLPQGIQTSDSLSTRWPLLWRKEELSWREKPRRTTKTILFSRKYKGKFSSSRCIYFHGIFKLISFHMFLLPFRFLYDKSSMEYLYFKNRVAVLRKDFLRPQNTSDNGKITSVFCFCCLFTQKNSNAIAKGVAHNVNVELSVSFPVFTK